MRWDNKHVDEKVKTVEGGSKTGTRNRKVDEKVFLPTPSLPCPFTLLLNDERFRRHP